MGSNPAASTTTTPAPTGRRSHPPRRKVPAISTTEIDLAARLEALQRGEDPDDRDLEQQMLQTADDLLAERQPDADGYRYFRPLEAAANEYVRWARAPQERIYLGIPEFDRCMRGIAPGELALVVGYAHSGKTVLITQMILNNPDKRIVLFTPDETRVLVLVKLASIVYNISAEDLEELIAQGDVDAERMLAETASKHFPNLAVFDDSLTPRQMSICLREVEVAMGGRPQAVVFDYLELLEGGEDVKALMTTIKAWGKSEAVPLVVLHQSSRTAGKDGAKVKIDSGGFGGEQQATFVLGVRRKKNEAMARILELEAKINGSDNPKAQWEDALAEARDDLRRHADTVTFNLVKNKRPPSRLVDDLDFRIDPDTGRVTPLEGSWGVSQHLAQDRGWDQPSFDDEEPF